MINKDASNSNTLTKLGFSFEKGGAHCSRTIMLDELTQLFEFVPEIDVTKQEYFKAITEENCLSKRSGKTRILTFRHLVDLYALDPSVVLFRTMRYFWQRDVDARPLIALLLAYARDSVLRSVTKTILCTPEGSVLTRETVEKAIDNIERGRFSEATLKSTAQNINSSFTKSGHLAGKAKKVRTRPAPTAGSVSFALFLGYLCGSRGMEMFETEFTKLLDCSFERMAELAEEASRKGWINCKRIGLVIEIVFPNLITQKELDQLYEKN